MRKIDSLGNFVDALIMPTVWFTEKSKTKWVRALGQVLAVPLFWWAIISGIVVIVVIVIAVIFLILALCGWVLIEKPIQWWKNV